MVFFFSNLQVMLTSATFTPMFTRFTLASTADKRAICPFGVQQTCRFLASDRANRPLRPQNLIHR